MILEDVLLLMFLWFASGGAGWWLHSACASLLRLKVPGPEYVIAAALGGPVACLVMAMAIVRAYIERRAQEEFNSMFSRIGKGLG